MSDEWWALLNVGVAFVSMGGMALVFTLHGRRLQRDLRTARRMGR